MFSLHATKTHFLFSAIHDSKGQNFTDQTGRFLVASKFSHSYMLVLYDYDSNYINYDPMTPIHVNSILTIYQKSITILIKSG